MRWLLALAFALTAWSAHGQGCSQCAETVGQTPARTQAAYRRGIVVLVVAGLTVMGGGLLVVRRFGK